MDTWQTVSKQQLDHFKAPHGGEWLGSYTLDQSCDKYFSTVTINANSVQRLGKFRLGVVRVH